MYIYMYICIYIYIYVYIYIYKYICGGAFRRVDEHRLDALGRLRLLLFCLLLSCATPNKSYMKRELNRNLPGNEVYHTACSLLVIFKNSCRELHCQKSFSLILFRAPSPPPPPPPPLRGESVQ